MLASHKLRSGKQTNLPPRTEKAARSTMKRYQPPTMSQAEVKNGGRGAQNAPNLPEPKFHVNAHS